MMIWILRSFQHMPKYYQFNLILNMTELCQMTLNGLSVSIWLNYLTINTEQPI